MHATRAAALLTAFALATGLPDARAATVVAALPDFDAPIDFATPLPKALGTVGTFAFSIPATAVITSASFGGTYGTQDQSFSTAGFDVAIDGGAAFTVCAPFALDCYELGPAFRPFLFPLAPAQFAGLLDGSATLAVTQTTLGAVRLGTPTLTIEYRDDTAVVPLPPSALLLGFGLGGLLFSSRRR